MKTYIGIKHPEWLRYPEGWNLNIERTLELVRSGRMPAAIAGWSLVVSLKHYLRAVYGSDLRAAWALLIIALQQIFEDKISDPVARLWYNVPFAYAWCVTFIAARTTKFPHWGRRESPEPVRCECGWAGMTRWTIHGYQDDGSGEDVEPVDECPRCGQEV